MIEDILVEPLLDGLAGDENPTHCRLLTETLVSLDLSPSVWHKAAKIIAPALSMADAGELDTKSAALLAHVPLLSVRRRLEAIAADDDLQKALPASIALADVQDVTVLPTLLRALADSPDEAVAHAVAALPLDPALLSKKELAQVLEGDLSTDDETRMWLAIALARLGDLEPFEQLWDALVRPPEFWKQSRRPVLLREPPPLFRLDPSTTIARLARLRPLPEKLVNFVASLRNNDYDTDWHARYPELVGDAHNPKLLIAGLIGAYDEPGSAPLTASDAARVVTIAERLAETPWQKVAQSTEPEPAVETDELRLLSRTPAELSALIIEGGINQLADQASGAGHSGLLKLAAALPPRIPVRIASVLRNPAVDQLPPTALAWALGRAGPAAAIQSLTPRILAAEGEERTRWLRWLSRITSQVDVPIALAGSDEAAPAVRRTIDVIDDTGRRTARARPPLLPNSTVPLEATADDDSEAAAQEVDDDDAEQAAQAAADDAEQPAQTIADDDSEATVDDASGSAAQPTLHEVFPAIGADDAHPLVATPVAFIVSLQDLPSTDTAGRVQLPKAPPDVEHTVRVHLRFGSEAVWDTLVWSAKRGTIKAASFTLPAPPAVEGERALCEARANFYLNQRWCGEARRNIDVRRDTTVPPLTDIPVPTGTPWGLALEPGATPADLIVRIQKGQLAGEFYWSCQSPHMDFVPPANGSDRMSLGEDAAEFVKKTFTPYAGLPLDKLKLANVEGAGEKIYNNTPPHFRDCYWKLWHAASDGKFLFDSVQIVTDEPCVPWELMRLADAKRAKNVPPELFAIRHCVGRWLAAESTALRQRISVSKVAVSASSYKDINKVAAKLPWADHELKLMIDHYRAKPVPLVSGDLLKFLEGGIAQAVHLACHGKMSIVQPDASVLVMEDTPNDLTPLSIARYEVSNGLGNHHPLVFLNACDVGAMGATLSLVAGFPAAFLYAGAAALISPLWAVNDERAHRIAEEFYRDVFVASPSKPLGAVLRDLRAKWKQENHLTYLAYVLYGDPMAMVDFRPS